MNNLYEEREKERIERAKMLDNLQEEREKEKSERKLLLDNLHEERKQILEILQSMQNKK